MTDKQKSWKEIRNKRREENFVGRGDELRVFTENFSDTPKYMVFGITGEGGVGKSTLLARFTSLATSDEIDAIMITCDDHHNSPVAAMGYIAGELAKLDISHKEFDDRYKKYSELRQEIESDPKVPRNAVNVISLGITDFTIKSLRKTPGVGVFAEYVDEKAAGEALAELVKYGIGKWGNKDEVQLLREPEKILTPLFVKLLQKVSKEKRIVIMFDVFERTGEVLSPWLLALFDFEYGELSTQVTFVISGRDPLEQHWTELAGMIYYVQLEPFTIDETNLYLSYQEITDKKVVEEIYQVTGGLPVLVELLAATKPQPGEELADISKDAVERFLQWTPQEVKRKAALLAAVPRQFNQDILTTILGEDASELFNWLVSQSYIRSTVERGWFYHEKVRELMIRYVWKTTPSRLTSSHEKLSKHFEINQGKFELTRDVAYANETWRKFEIERVYHNLSAHPDKNIYEATNSFLLCFRWKWGFAEHIARIVMQVATEKKNKLLHNRSILLTNLYSAYDQDDYEAIIQKTNQIKPEKALTVTAHAVLFSISGEAYQMTGKVEAALADFNSAIELDDKYAWAIASRGQTYHSMEKYKEAIADFTRAIELDENTAWYIAVRGRTYRSMEKYNEAIADFTRAIELDEKYAWAINGRAYTYRRMGKFKQAIKGFKSSIEINPEDPNITGNCAGLLLSEGILDEGIAMLEKLISKLPYPDNPGLEPELWFYAYAHWPTNHTKALKKLKEVLSGGERSPDWDLSMNIARARKDGHPAIEWLKKLADVIGEKADISVLDEWQNWKKA